jgi:glypican 1
MPVKQVVCVAGEHLRVCPQGLTCCTEEMEHNLSAQSRQEFDRAVRDTLNKLGTLLKLRAQRFDGKFQRFHVSNLVDLGTVSFKT